MPRRPRRDRAAEAPRAADAFHHSEQARPRPGLAMGGPAACETILDHAFRLLEEHGVAVVHEPARAALLKAGATEGMPSERVRFARAMVREALQVTPKSVLLAGKTRDRDVTLPRRDHGFIMRTGTGAHGFLDVGSQDFRNLDIADVARIARLANGLDQVGFVAHPFAYGVPELTSDIHGVGELVTRTDKHIWLQP